MEREGVKKKKQEEEGGSKFRTGERDERKQEMKVKRVEVSKTEEGKPVDWGEGNRREADVQERLEKER